MSYAYKAATLVSAYCEHTWPHDPASAATTGCFMASTMWDVFADAFDIKGSGSHKYIPADEYTAHLGMPLGAGVYGYTRMADDSLVLLTCKGPLAVADGSGCRWLD